LRTETSICITYRKYGCTCISQSSPEARKKVAFAHRIVVAER